MERNSNHIGDSRVMPSEHNRVSTGQLKVDLTASNNPQNKPQQNDPSPNLRFHPKDANVHNSQENYVSEFNYNSIIGDPNNPHPHNLKIYYDNLVVSKHDFVDRVVQDIAFSNQVLGPIEDDGRQRIRLKQGLLEKKDHKTVDFMFKFKVTLFGSEWT